MNEQSRCACADFAANIELINGPIVMAAVRSGSAGYPGKRFTHCPWCGSELQTTPAPDGEAP